LNNRWLTAQRRVGSTSVRDSALAYADLTSEPSPFEVMPVDQLVNPGEVAAMSLLPSFSTS
jgi:hypothetical protein